MPPFTLADAAAICVEPYARRIVPLLPWASAQPLWSGATPAEVERAGGRYGTLIATPAARGAWQLCHAPGERMHVATVFSDPGDVIELAGRRWIVRKLIDQVA